MKPNSRVVSLIGPPDLAFARERGMNWLMKVIFSLISYKIIRKANRHNIDYSFLFVRPDGQQLAEISKVIDAGHIVPVIDKVYPFDQTMAALAYLEAGRAKGKVVIKII